MIQKHQKKLRFFSGIMSTYYKAIQSVIKYSAYIKRTYMTKKIVVGDNEFWVTPEGFRSWFRMYPYFVGTNVWLKLYVKNYTNQEKTFFCKWKLLRWDDKNINEVDSRYISVNVAPKKKVYVIPDISYLSIPGEHVFQLKIIDYEQKEQDTIWENMINISLLSNVKKFYALVNIGSVIIGIIVSIIAQLLLRYFNVL